MGRQTLLLLEKAGQAVVVCLSLAAQSTADLRERLEALAAAIRRPGFPFRQAVSTVVSSGSKP